MQTVLAIGKQQRNANLMSFSPGDAKVLNFLIFGVLALLVQLGIVKGSVRQSII
jgi:hypothetical protein